MEKKHWLKLFAALALAVGLAGCWDAKDINDRDIVTGVVVDKTDYGFAIYAEIPSIMTGGSKEGGGTSPAPPAILMAEGRTASEARETLDRMADRPIFVGAVQAVILTDRLASYDIEEYLLRLRQINEYRKTVHVLITTDDPKTLLGNKSENAQSAGFAIDSTIMSLISQGHLYNVTLMDVLENLAAPYKHYIVPTIAVMNNEITFTGYTVFSGGQKTGFIPASDARCIIFVKEKNARFDYTVPYDTKSVTVEVKVKKKTITPHYEQGNIRFDVNMDFIGTMIYPESDKVIPETDMTVINATLKAMLEKEFVESFQRSQGEYDCDYCNLNEVFRIRYPEEYKRMDWAGEYRKASIILDLNVRLLPVDLIDYNPN